MGTLHSGAVRANRPATHRGLGGPGAGSARRAHATELTVDRVALWSQRNEAGLAPTTAKIALITLNQVCRFALRRSWLADNPVARLEPGEKPRWTPGRVAILERR